VVACRIRGGEGMHRGRPVGCCRIVLWLLDDWLAPWLLHVGRLAAAQVLPGCCSSATHLLLSSLTKSSYSRHTCTFSPCKQVQ
jgi:hypothetical protein